jgi:hypothetical protein
MSKNNLDLNNINVGLIITGLLGMIEDDGLNPHEAFELLDEIKRQTWSALIDIKNGN